MAFDWLSPNEPIIFSRILGHEMAPSGPISESRILVRIVQFTPGRVDPIVPLPWNKSSFKNCAWSWKSPSLGGGSRPSRGSPALTTGPPPLSRVKPPGDGSAGFRMSAAAVWSCSDSFAAHPSNGGAASLTQWRVKNASSVPPAIRALPRKFSKPRKTEHKSSIVIPTQRVPLWIPPCGSARCLIGTKTNCYSL